MHYRFALSEISSSIVQGDLQGSGSATIEIFDSSNLSVTLTSNSCTEIGSTGIFTFPLSNIATAPTSYTQYAYVITRGTQVDFGSISFGGYAENAASLIPAGKCKVFLNIFNPDDTPASVSQIFNILSSSSARIISGFYQTSSAKSFTVYEVNPDFDSSTGQASWIFPHGANVSFKIEGVGISKDVIIPSINTVDLNLIV